MSDAAGENRHLGGRRGLSTLGGPVQTVFQGETGSNATFTVT